MGFARSPNLTMAQDPLVQIHEEGYCVLRQRFSPDLVRACRTAFWPILLTYIEEHHDAPNRGPHRHFLPMPFTPPIFAPECFFDEAVLRIVRGAMDDRVVADQWGCDAPVRGSEYQGPHIDYQRPLFPETPDLRLPIYMLVVSFGLVRVTLENGPIEIAPGTHRLSPTEAQRAVEASEIAMQPVPLEIGDVLIRHPWTLHRGSPNRTDAPRALLTIRYVRRWYADDSREVLAIPRFVWESLTPEQQGVMRFPVEDG
ncbi:MAG TPA: phytanoyl-CoA dioxygenase family protein [Candidatus Acidoferrales bacterium]|nr:phytanoyl-CoA dioxygenase family protein [Candidatus Acidoferrales bacterium]